MNNIFLKILGPERLKYKTTVILLIKYSVVPVISERLPDTLQFP